MSTRPMAVPFPAPSPAIEMTFEELRVAAANPPESVAELRRIATLPRPWEPSSCLGEMRRLIYAWLDEVVAWINEEHTWRTDRVVPHCWSEHPHIVHELATIACVRWEARVAVTPAPLEEWQRYTLPMFLDRIALRIGEAGCPPGRHLPSPGGGRYRLYRDGAPPTERRLRRNQDSELA